MMKYAERMMTEGRRPPHIDLNDVSAVQGFRKDYPRNENTSPTNHIRMKFRASASPLSESARIDKDTIRFSSVILD